MDDFIAFGPILIAAGLCAVANMMCCYCGVRRFRTLEQRLQSLERVQVDTSHSEQQQQPSTVYPPLSYVQPTLYTYAQQPSAPMYYSQDPQAIQTVRTQVQGTYQYS
jgi:hypothetical protein